MKQLSATLPQVICLAAASVATLLGCATSAAAQTVPSSVSAIISDTASLARISADLAYPNSAQRFFEAGDARLEEEIRRLSEDDTQTEPLLTIKPDVLKQFEDE